MPQLPPRTPNNTLAIAYWRGAAARARQGGWFDRVFDYTCDEPGADPTRYPVCAAHAETLHAADAELKATTGPTPAFPPLFPPCAQTVRSVAPRR